MKMVNSTNGWINGNVKLRNNEMKKMKKGSGIAFGIIFGTVIGFATDNIGLWLSMGIVFGAAYEAKLAKLEPQQENES